MKHEISFRPLQDELTDLGAAESAGHHDLQSWTIRSQYADKDIVARHESLHDRLLQETPYGNVQFLFRRLSLISKSERLRREASDWTDKLLSASRNSHERYAIYLSVKGFRAREHEGLILQHPLNYQVYYSDLAKLIDPFWGSSYLQYILGMIIMEICFASDLQRTLLDWRPGNELSLKGDDEPDKRFHELIRLLPRPTMEVLVSLVDKCIKDCSSEIGLPSDFDPHSEHHWEKLPVGISGAIESLVQPLIRSFLYEKAMEAIPCLRHGEWLSVRRSFFEHMADVTGLRLFGADLGDPVPAEYLLTSRGRYGARAALSLVDNEPQIDLHQTEIYDGDDPFGFLSRATGETFLIFEPAADSENWTFLNLEEEDAYAGRLSYAAVRRFFAMRRIMTAMGSPIRDVNHIVIGVKWGGHEVFPALYNEIVKFHDLGQAYFHSANVFWYVTGDFVGCCKYLMTRGECQHMLLWGAKEDAPSFHGMSAEEARELLKRVDSQSVIDFEKMDPGMVSGLQGHLFRCENAFGSFLRFCQSDVSRSILGALVQDFLDGSISDVPMVERASLREAAVWALRAIQLAWRRF